MGGGGRTAGWGDGSGIMLFFSVYALRTAREGGHQREQKAKYLFFGLKESRHTNIFCFCIAFWPTCWPKSDRKEANIRVAALLQCEI